MYIKQSEGVTLIVFDDDEDRINFANMLICYPPKPGKRVFAMYDDSVDKKEVERLANIEINN